MSLSFSSSFRISFDLFWSLMALVSSSINLSTFFSSSLLKSNNFSNAVRLLFKLSLIWLESSLSPRIFSISSFIFSSWVFSGAVSSSFLSSAGFSFSFSSFTGGFSFSVPEDFSLDGFSLVFSSEGFQK